MAAKHGFWRHGKQAKQYQIQVSKGSEEGLCVCHGAGDVLLFILNSKLNDGQADKHIIENWNHCNFEQKRIKFPGEAYLASKEVPWSSNRFELERYLREDNESEGKVSTSSFLLFQCKVYCEKNGIASESAES